MHCNIVLCGWIPDVFQFLDKSAYKIHQPLRCIYSTSSLVTHHDSLADRGNFLKVTKNHGLTGPNQVEVRNVGPMYDVSIYLIGIKIEAYVLSGNDSLRNPWSQGATERQDEAELRKKFPSQGKGGGMEGERTRVV